MRFHLHSDGELALEAGKFRQIPDTHLQLEQAGAVFYLLYEIDNATEPLDSSRDQLVFMQLDDHYCSV